MIAVPCKGNRGGAAAVEMAVILPFLLTLLVGLWEIGRMIQVTQILDEATREGARLAASGSFTASNNFPTMIVPPSTGTGYEVQRAVIVYLQQAGIQTINPTTGDAVKVTVANATQGYTATYTAGGSYSSTASSPGADPAANANPTTVNLNPGNVTIFIPQSLVTAASAQGNNVNLPPLDTMSVTVTIPYKNIGWDQLNWFSLPDPLTNTISFRSLRNIPLTF